MARIPCTRATTVDAIVTGNRWPWAGARPAPRPQAWLHGGHMKALPAPNKRPERTRVGRTGVGNRFCFGGMAQADGRLGFKISRWWSVRWRG